jgi:hypothetical protein
VVLTVCTTPPTVDKVDTSLAEILIAQTLVARLRSKVPDDNLVDDDPDLLNFTMVEFEITCQTSSQLQKC